jgi:Domain of unknown function (DUF4124)
MKKPRALTIFALLSVVTSLVAIADQTVYKWNDAQGGLHYTQRPPVGIASEAIVVRRGYSAPDASAREQSPEELQAAAKAERCQIASKNLEMLSEAGAVKRRDQYGQDHTLSAEEKDTERESAQAAVDQNCPSPT